MTLAIKVGEGKIGGRSAIAVQGAHRCVIGICRDHLRISQRRGGKPLHIREVEVLVADRGIRVVEVSGDSLLKVLEDIG